MILLFRTLAATLALGSMLLRAVLPVGWMPVPTGPSGPELVICSIDGLHHRAPVRDPDHRSPKDQGVVCPFAAAAQLAPVQAPIAVPRPIVIAQTALVVAFSLAFPSAYMRGHSPRGPPPEQS